MRLFRSLPDFKSIRITPRRGRAKHGLVGPVFCFARTADEMLPIGLHYVQRCLRKGSESPFKTQTFISQFSHRARRLEVCSACSHRCRD